MEVGYLAIDVRDQRLEFVARHLGRCVIVAVQARRVDRELDRA